MIVLARSVNLKIVLLGLESSGKTTLLGKLSPKKIPIRGSNVKGSTSDFYEVDNQHIRYVDTPGIRQGSELVTSRYTKKLVSQADKLLLVVRGTHFKVEIVALNQVFALDKQPIVIVVTFEDKMDSDSLLVLYEFAKTASAPIYVTDTRSLVNDEMIKSWHMNAIQFTAKQIQEVAELPVKPLKEPFSLFRIKGFGFLFAFIALFCMYAFPIFMAYQFSKRAEGIAESYILNSLGEWGALFPDWVFGLLLGDYGLVSLGIYSLVWAFP